MKAIIKTGLQSCATIRSHRIVINVFFNHDITVQREACRWLNEAYFLLYLVNLPFHCVAKETTHTNVLCSCSCLRRYWKKQHYIPLTLSPNVLCTSIVSSVWRLFAQENIWRCMIRTLPTYAHVPYFVLTFQNEKMVESRSMSKLRSFTLAFMGFQPTHFVFKWGVNIMLYSSWCYMKTFCWCTGFQGRRD